MQTEFEFTLPVGYLDQNGALHKQGVMRMATAMDEILPLRDARVRTNQAYLAIVLLSRVVVRLGTLPAISTNIIENLFAADLTFLQSLYVSVNETGKTTVTVTCPHCQTDHEVDLAELGGA